MEPAKTIILALGGPTEVAKVVGVHRTRVSMWKVPRAKGGTGGVIPHWHIEKLMAAAREKDVSLSLRDFAPVVGISS
ncbi:hypothetical protein SAMN04488032_12710 [Pacificibacter marinus]|jgi:hypothetical protein|uniref:Helix-turn-helix domain-containing protein n=1 Tax=Pacificibacter marinus TaxID=658057 RepID=A0A1Y5TF59_9RHOB|nr:hypothetical protein SAMN04488032_12710 [Pacificibacter marinus]SLN60493.1 hypothetical protein PAM7971_03103 [Pacificibacter marinus]